MQNKIYNVQFSDRLRELMIQRGYASHTAHSGVSPAALSKAIGCFTEMALRYLDGRSIPNIENLLKIAQWLNVDPGYLLFGEQHKLNENKNQLKIDRQLLDYTLKKITPFLKKTTKEEDLLDFFMSILTDLSQMEIDTENLKKVFDLALRSSALLEKNIRSIEYGKSSPTENFSKAAS